MKNYLLASIAFLCILTTACNKEGKGGAATLEGKIMVKLVKESTMDSLTTYEALDEKVYIVYGENTTFDDDTRTSYNGNYKFDFLYKGMYTVYVYSECARLLDSCPDGTEAFIEKISVNSSNGTTTVPTITITKLIN